MTTKQRNTIAFRGANEFLDRRKGFVKSMPAPGSHVTWTIDFDDYADLPEIMEQWAHLLRAELRHVKTATLAHDAILIFQDAMFRGVNIVEERMKRRPDVKKEFGALIRTIREEMRRGREGR